MKNIISASPGVVVIFKTFKTILCMVSTQDTSLRRGFPATAHQEIALPDFVIKGPTVRYYTAIEEGHNTVQELTEHLGLWKASDAGYDLSVLTGVGFIERVGREYRITQRAVKEVLRGRSRQETVLRGSIMPGTRLAEFYIAVAEGHNIVHELTEHLGLTNHGDAGYHLRVLSDLGVIERVGERYRIKQATIDISEGRKTTKEVRRNRIKKVKRIDSAQHAGAAKYLDSWKTEATMELAIPDSERLLPYLGISPELDECLKIFRNIMAKLPEGQAKRVASLFFGIILEDRAVDIVHVNAAYRIGHALEDHIDRREDPEPLIRHLEAINKIDPAGIETYMHDFARLRKSRAVPVNMTSGVAYPTQGIADFTRMVEIRYNKMGMRVPSAVAEGILTLESLPQNYIQTFLRIVGRKNYPVQKAVAFASELAGKDVRKAAYVISKYTIG